MGLFSPLVHILAALIAYLPLVKAIAPFTSGDDEGFGWPGLKLSDRVSFDPLGVLAILRNPRASASAARLYSQPDRPIFRWPHMMQVGAVLAPVHAIAQHLTSNYQSIHPANSLFLENVDTLSVRSNIGKTLNLFPILRIPASDSALIDLLNFKSSGKPTNDILVVNLEENNPHDDDEAAIVRTANVQSPGHRGFNKILVLLTEITMGIIPTTGLVFGVLLTDPWAIALFAAYLIHWASSTAISFRRMIVQDKSLEIRHDQSVVYAIYERPSGGYIVFKGSQYIMESWARTTWIFSVSGWNTILHWLWMVSGTIAALASIICMVNMNGWLQLGFLGMLMYSSVAELWLTVLCHELQSRSLSSVGRCAVAPLRSNDKKYKSIIQATLCGDDPALDGEKNSQEYKKFRLDTLNWIEMGLLPPNLLFQAMMTALRSLVGVDELGNQTGAPVEIAQTEATFMESLKNIPDADKVTRDGIWAEIKAQWQGRG